MKLSDLVEAKLLAEMIDGGYVRVQAHSARPLRILNYSQRAQWDRVWNDATKRCRGLIVNGDDQVVARPFPKFFNLSEHNGDIPAEPFQVFDKLDGSLGILYDGDCIATRGAFESPQARQATGLLRRRYPAFKGDPDLTYLFEIIYPGNRIVVDYGATEDLFLLTVIENATGKELDDAPWPGPRVEPLAGFGDLPSVLAAHRPNAEGYVLRFDSGLRVKVKHDEYVRLHKLLTGVSSVTIWELLSTEQSLEVILECVPDEFYQWVKVTADGLRADFNKLAFEIVDQFQAAGPPIDRGENVSREDRKRFALAVAQHPHKSAFFSLLNGRSVHDYIWKRLRPERTVPFRLDEP